MIRKMLCCFFVLALAAAGASQRYRVTLLQPATLNGEAMKAGEYQLTVDGGKAIFKMGKRTVEAPVKVEAAERKFADTACKFVADAGKLRLAEIRIGGAATKLIFD